MNAVALSILAGNERNVESDVDMTESLVKRLLRPLVRPLVKLLVHAIPSADDPWQKEPAKVAPRRFGPGNIHDWAWYMEGNSLVRVESPKGIVDWLRECKYVGDSVQFGQADFWQHPVAFETTRRGDCEDHALWAWRKLKELGISAEFVCGRGGPMTARGNVWHAWVMLTLNDQLYLMETTAKSRQQMTLPFSEAKQRYCPAYSVDTNLRTYRYAGYIECMKLNLECDWKHEGPSPSSNLNLAGRAQNETERDMSLFAAKQ